MPSPSVNPPADISAADDASSFHLTGFRSVPFGADEAEVRDGIIKDFSVDAAAIHKIQNLADRTDGLTVKVPEVLKDGGAADVAYVLGYKSKKLIQVSIIWSKASDKDLTAERLLANGETLKNYFLGEGYVPSTIVSNSPVRGGLLLFRGADADGHTTALILQGTTTAGADKSNTFLPNALLLFYLADPKAPDVFKIPAGKF
jgi:hypothetical protein